MADETAVVKDPNKKNFWTIKNIAGLFLLAAMPLSASKVFDFFENQSKLVERVKALETEQANNKAIWQAITDQRNRMVEIEIEHKAGMLAIDREFRKSNVDRAIERFLDRELGTQEGTLDKTLLPDKPLIPEPRPEPKPKPDPTVLPQQFPPPQVEQKPIDPDQFRNLYEEKFPIKKGGK